MRTNIGNTLDKEIIELHSQGNGQKRIAAILSERHGLRITQTHTSYAFKRLNLKPHIGSSNGGLAVWGKTKIQHTVEQHQKKQRAQQCINYKGFRDLPLFSRGNVFKARYRNDPTFRIKTLLRRRIRNVIESRGYKPRSKEVLDQIGCSADELKQHFESMFQEGMSWENFGEWHIDHIIPLASVRGNTIEELIQGMIRLNHYSNLQPLWAKDNIKKGSMMPTPPPGHRFLVKEICG
jgi:hypothetical protein